MCGFVSRLVTRYYRSVRLIGCLTASESDTILALGDNGALLGFRQLSPPVLLSEWYRNSRLSVIRSRACGRGSQARRTGSSSKLDVRGHIAQVICVANTEQGRISGCPTLNSTIRPMLKD